MKMGDADQGKVIESRLGLAEAKNGASKERPILLRIETKAGHGQGKPVTKQIEESTDMYSFLFWQLGVKP